MTLTEIEAAARNRYNSVGDSFWSSDEIIQLCYDACLEMSREAMIIESSSTASTAIGTRNYVFPTKAIALKRVEYNGRKLDPISFIEDDALTGLNSSTTETGTPQFYAQWNGYVYLRPVPAAVGTLTYYFIKEPAAMTTGSTLEIPTMFHMDLVSYIVWQMAEKDLNFSSADRFSAKWQKAIMKAQAWQKKRKRTDGFASVKDEQVLAGNYSGPV